MCHCFFLFPVLTACVQKQMPVSKVLCFVVFFLVFYFFIDKVFSGNPVAFINNKYTKFYCFH